MSLVQVCRKVLTSSLIHPFITASSNQDIIFSRCLKIVNRNLFQRRTVSLFLESSTHQNIPTTYLQYRQNVTVNKQCVIGLPRVFTRSITHLTTNPHIPVEQDYFKMVETMPDRVLQLDKPISEVRLYRHIVLKNKLEAILISDEKCDKAACSLNVGIGSLFDPKELQGLAHFLEHMLFLGTKKYPNEDEYNRFLQQHGGSSNAFTSDLNTCYHFSVAIDSLEGAIDRFCQFFIHPLFTQSATDRELDAVHSEHCKNTLSDDRRKYQLIKHLSNPYHPFAHFGTGNHQTLRDIPRLENLDVRTSLLNFYKQFYSANIMRLCIIGRESLDELEKMITTERFDLIQNNDVHVPKGEEIGYPEIPFRSEDLKKLIKVLPIRDTRSICFQWVLPEQIEKWESKPTRYLSHLLGHEGKGSLLSKLKAEGFATELSAGSLIDCAGISLFQCKINLTESALQSQENLERIGYLVFKYIELLQTNPIQEWVNNELTLLAETEFKFLSQSPPASHVVNVSQSMHYFPPNRILSGNYLIWKHDLKEIQEVLECLIPSKLSVTISTQAFKKDSTEQIDQQWEKEPYYQTLYHVSTIPENLLSAWTGETYSQSLESTSDHITLAFPKPNIFVPENLDLKPKFDAIIPEIPQKMELSNDLFVKSQVYFKQDNIFNLPKAIILLRFSSPYPRLGLKELSITELYFLTIQQLVNEYAYDAEVAGLHYGLCASLDSRHGGELTGFELQVSGYNDTLQQLLETLCKHLVSPDLTTDAFNVAKTILLRELRILATNRQPYQQAMQNQNKFLQFPYYTAEERLSVIDTITYDDIVSFATSNVLFDDVILEALIQGNVLKEEGERYIRRIYDIFYHSKKMGQTNVTWTPSCVTNLNSPSLPKPSRYRYTKQASHPEEPNNAVVLTIQAGILTIEEAAFLNLASHYLNQPFFDTLRTKQQLGYIVAVSPSRNLHCNNLAFIVQSQWLPPNEITLRIEGFLDYYVDQVEERLSEEVFNNLRYSTISQLEEKPKRIIDEAVRNYGEIILRRFDFNRREKQCDFLRSTTRDDFINFLKTKLMNSPWFLSQVESQMSPQPAPESTSTQDVDQTSMNNKSLLEPSNPTIWTDIEDNPDNFLKLYSNNFFVFPTPGETIH